MSKNRGYTLMHPVMVLSGVIVKRKHETLIRFGERLTALRKAAGYTQTELADEVGVTRRMIAYYEGETEYPPTALLPAIAQVLNVSTDELLGIKPIKKTRKPDTRLQRRMQQIEKMSATKKRQVLQVIDTFIEAEQFKQKKAG